jgi:hypothetical protein
VFIDLLVVGLFLEPMNQQQKKGNWIQRE